MPSWRRENPSSRGGSYSHPSIVWLSVRPVTEPVPSATSPRRTVRVAVALVAGQAALCAVIGFVTFGPGPGSTSAGQAGAEARAPVVMPTANIGLPAAPLPPVPGKSTAPPPKPQVKPSRVGHAKAEPSPKRTTRRAAAPPKPISAPTTTKPAASKPPDIGVAPTATPGNEFQLPVKKGDECETEGDRGRTLGGDAVRCAKGEDGALSWQTA